VALTNWLADEHDPPADWDKAQESKHRLIGYGLALLALLLLAGIPTLIVLIAIYL
jgi:hypothetical protein